MTLFALGNVLCFYLVSRLSLSPLHCERERERFGLLHSLALVGVLILQRDYSVRKRSSSAKVAFFTASAFAFLLYNGYTAILTSSMISK